MNKKIIYFTKGPRATEAESTEAKQMGAVLRNGSAVGENDYVEKCDGVAGAVPPVYAKRFKLDEAQGGAPEKEHQQAAAGQLPNFQTMKVNDLREFAKDRGIPIPAHVNTRDEITAHLTEVLTGANS